MTVTRLTSVKIHAWAWILVGFLVGLIVLSLATRVAGATPLGDDKPTTIYISSWWDGVFHASPHLGGVPFVEVGSRVEPGTVVGLIEGMRRYEQPATVSGTVVEVLVGDSEMVYRGQPLFRVELDPESEET